MRSVLAVQSLPVMTHNLGSRYPCRAPCRAAHPTRRPSEPAAMFHLVGICVALGLAGFNAWWYWRDNRPRPDLATISRLMSHDQYAQAEPALREHLRRSPHDGEARMMLARLHAARGDLLNCARAATRSPLLVAAEMGGAVP